jgi:hypothetical protein
MPTVQSRVVAHGLRATQRRRRKAAMAGRPDPVGAFSGCPRSGPSRHVMSTDVAPSDALPIAGVGSVDLCDEDFGRAPVRCHSAAKAKQIHPVSSAVREPIS